MTRVLLLFALVLAPQLSFASETDALDCSKPNTNLNDILAVVPTSWSGMKGHASWYGPGFHGKKTASGEIFNQNAPTAAHKSVKLKTNWRVTNLKNGKSIVVRVNDRGPFVKGRMIDLSKAAAQSSGISGVGMVEMEPVK